MLMVVTDTVDEARTAKILSALADPVRLRFVRDLARAKERSGSEVAEALGISLALLCHHSRILVESGIVDKRKEAQTAYYSVNKRLLKACLKGLV
jgi:DNA-binding transcriptional ArsR family regulator